MMAYDYDATFTKWFSFSSAIERVVSTKLILLLTTVCFAISAQTRVLPKLRKGKIEKLPEMAVHIIGVTCIGITMVILGSFVRYGGF